MCRFLLLTASCWLSLFSFSQQKKTFVVKAGEAVFESIPFSEIYQYPAFAPGRVYFRGGEVSQGMLNYNALTAEMDFIDPNGDTLALANEPLPQLIVIGKDSFAVHNGYFKLIAGTPQGRLGKRAVFTTAKIENTGAYDQPMPASSEIYGGFSNGNHVNRLVLRQTLTLVRQTAFYFGNRNNEFFPASRKNLFRVFGKQEAQVSEYLRNNNVDFTSEADLVKLVNHLTLEGKSGKN